MFKIPLTTAVAVLGFSTAIWAEVPRVTTDIAPIHGLVSRVMQGLGEPSLVVPVGASPHDHAMRPSEAMALSRADAVFWLGEVLTPWLDRAMDELAGQAQVTELLDVEGTLILPFREGVGFEAHHHSEDAHEDDHNDHDDDHTGEHEDDPEKHAHDEAHDEHGEAHDDDHEEGHDEEHSDEHGHDGHEGVDPHAWLSPENAQLWLEVIAAELSRLDPENAATYAANAAAGRAEIQTARAQIAESLSRPQSGGFVVFHDAYQYFEHSFGIQAAGAIALSDASDPSPARIAEIQQVVKDHAVSCVFSEPQFNPDLVATVLEGSAAKTVVIDPMGTGLELGSGFYVALLHELGAAMVACR
ncbi:metal ABC transporter solute-binding protein, Zn/Mn family [Pseudophaeobacter leonis]|uniref:metal ABC transporter solute-binding protein, Zn/Mn family n=1 Tax=Pseudophaeobacter leonis TaxID=1144477 RepID=UPI0009F36215|nr:zinc ABC transporter substrate-binding protein [Pseudophaeobacter leonis]